MTSVLIADFQFLTRKGLYSLVDSLPEFYVSHQLTDEMDLVNKPEIDADVIIVDISSNNESHLDIIFENGLVSKSAIMVVTNNLNKEFIQQLINNGVKGILTKRCKEEEIVNALNLVSRGNRFFCNTIFDLVATINEPVPPMPSELSPREFEVLKLITKGYTTNKIAHTLSLSVHTINSHRKNILRKLKLSSPAELIVYALESGLVKNQESSVINY